MSKVDEAIARAEPIIVRGQLKAAINRLTAHFEGLDTVEAQRALVEKVHLITGDRRTKAVSVHVGRRHGDADG